MENNMPEDIKYDLGVLKFKDQKRAEKYQRIKNMYKELRSKIVKEEDKVLQFKSEVVWEFL